VCIRSRSFDSWYSSLENLKQVRRLNWHWLTRLKSNRSVDLDGSGNRAVRQLLIPMLGLIVHLKGYGFIKVFKIATPNGNMEYWATDDLTMTIWQLAAQAEKCWRIEAYHRGIKQ
jgi:putative transposase